MERCDQLTYVAFDLETTGLRPAADRIIEIGAVRFTASGVAESFQTLVDPDMPISPAAAAVNGLTDAMLQGQPKIEAVLPGFLDFIAGAVIIAHHAPFDVGFVSYELLRQGLKGTEKAVLDTCAMSRRVFKGLPSYSLINLARHLNLETTTFHRAVEDAEVCRQLFIKNDEARPQPVTVSQLERLSGPVLNLNLWDNLFSEDLHGLRAAFAAGEPVTIVYEDARKHVSERRVTPLALTVLRGSPVLEAWCHLRGEKRCFTLARIKSLR